jgi:ABC-type lipoprotein export system ATPase subunit
MIGGLDRPSAGRLFVDGKDLFKLNEAELVEYKRSTVGFVWQNNARNLIPYLTALENIMMPMDFNKVNKKAVKNGNSAPALSARQKHERARQLLELTGLGAKRKSKLNQLSGGEQQRVAIALALANSPRVLLADEPTGSVDVRTSELILDIFRNVNKELGTTIIIVTHDRQLSKKVNRVVSIRDGKTSSEMLIKQNYADALSQVVGFENGAAAVQDAEHEEFAVLDRAGRVQIPREYLDKIGVSGNKIKLELQEGRITISGPGAMSE